jgi:hypothetical protein
MKLAEEEWDQSDLRLENYTQNSDKKIPAEKSNGLVRSGYRTCLVHTKNFSKFKSLFPPLILELRGTKIDEI